MKQIFTTLALVAATATQALASDEQILRAFDVAEDHTRFVFAPTPVDANGMPEHGNPFVAQGYVYPAGVLADGETGVNEDGSPTHPELVLGEWTCDGWFVGDAMATETGTFLISRQTVVLNSGDVLISHGPEIVDPGMPQVRAVTGGTGSFAAHDGDLHQTFIEWSEHMGLRASFVLLETEESEEEPHEIDRD